MEGLSSRFEGDLRKMFYIMSNEDREELLQDAKLFMTDGKTCLRYTGKVNPNIEEMQKGLYVEWLQEVGIRQSKKDAKGIDYLISELPMGRVVKFSEELSELIEKGEDLEEAKEILYNTKYKPTYAPEYHLFT